MKTTRTNVTVGPRSSKKSKKKRTRRYRNSLKRRSKNAVTIPTPRKNKRMR